MSVSSPSVFLLNVSGQVEAGRFMGGDNLHFNYCFTAGQDWEVVSVSHSNLSLSDMIVWPVLQSTFSVWL